MHKSILVALVICALLIVDSQGWRRWRIRGRKLLRHAITAGAVATALGGKRAAPCPEPPTPDEMNQLNAELQATCLDVGVNVKVTGLNRTQVEAIFQDNDANADGVLKDAEISTFSEFIQTVEACVAFGEDRKK